MSVCKGCAFEYEWKQGDTSVPGECIDCKVVDGKPTNFKPKPMTNADRIRAMSDEELVEHFWEAMDDDKFCTGICNEQRDCNLCRLTWLKQPAEEGT